MIPTFAEQLVQKRGFARPRTSWQCEYVAHQSFWLVCWAIVCLRIMVKLYKQLIWVKVYGFLWRYFAWMSPHSSKITFQSNQNRLVEVFRHLNGFLFETSTGIRNWLCSNFMYRSRAGIKKLNPHSVWDILSKAKGESSPKSRICKIEWLEYKTLTVLK